MANSHRKMTYPAPKRIWEKGPNGLWSSRPWTKEEQSQYRAIGGWFSMFPGGHDVQKTQE